MSVRCEVDVEGVGPNQKRRSSGVFSSLWSLDEQWSTHTLQKNGWWAWTRTNLARPLHV